MLRFFQKTRLTYGARYELMLSIFGTILISVFLIFAPKHSNASLTYWTITAILILILAFSIISPILSGLLYSIASFICVMLPSSIYTFGLAWLGFSILLALFIIEGYGLAGITLFIAYRFLADFMSPAVHFQDNIIGILVIVGVALCLGLPYRQQLSAFETKLKSSVQAVREGVAADLHDTTARELSKALLTLQDINEDTAPGQAISRTRQVEQDIRSALCSLREIIAQSAKPTDDSLTQVIKECEMLVRKRGIILETTINGEVKILDEMLRKLLAVLIREASLNMLKYAKENSTASLTLDIIEQESVEVSVVNEINPGNSPTEIRGGFGLNRIWKQAAELGGELAYGVSMNQWALSAVIPLERTEE